MPDLITLTGVVATEPRHITTNAGLEITSFRLASSQRKFDREQKRWVEADTNWYTVTAFRQLAANAASCLKLGQRVLVTGRLRIRDWQNNDKSGTTVEIEAEALGHDLSWGTTVFARSAPPAGAGSGDAPSAEAWPGGSTEAAGPVATQAGDADHAGDVGDAGDAGARREAVDLVPF
ncbi:single-stranded DNA-binding protein [Herbiconiux sp. P18]|uniref:single-stranded DNA-binding protein n=1 Tax=Herbiconiux liangxiaofengii TaxID=3342795 RepID=UPI0035B7AC92